MYKDEIEVKVVVGAIYPLNNGELILVIKGAVVTIVNVWVDGDKT